VKARAAKRNHCLVLFIKPDLDKVLVDEPHIKNSLKKKTWGERNYPIFQVKKLRTERLQVA
jgi:hypothetical protein